MLFACEHGEDPPLEALRSVDQGSFQARERHLQSFDLLLVSLEASKIGLGGRGFAKGEGAHR